MNAVTSRDRIDFMGRADTTIDLALQEDGKHRWEASQWERLAGGGFWKTTLGVGRTKWTAINKAIRNLRKP